MGVQYAYKKLGTPEFARRRPMKTPITYEHIAWLLSLILSALMLYGAINYWFFSTKCPSSDEISVFVKNSNPAGMNVYVYCDQALLTERVYLKSAP